MAARPIENSSGQGYIYRSGHISLEPDSFHDQLKFDKATDFGILAQPIREVDKNAGRKYPVMPPKTGQAVIWLSDGLNSQAKKYDIEIKEVAGDRFILTMSRIMLLLELPRCHLIKMKMKPPVGEYRPRLCTGSW